jgi:hypothetical protein
VIAVTTLLTPYDRGDAKLAGRKIWRKQLLPVGKIHYDGRVIDFTRDYLSRLAAAFRDRALDQVPFQLAGEQNTHTRAVRDFGGEVAALELTDDGLDVVVAATEDADKILRENPRLGISARIKEKYSRADGKFYEVALEHVLGTLDPRITGMRPWEAVEAANDDGPVTDLTGCEYELATPDAAPQPATNIPEQPAQQSPAKPATLPEETNMALTTDQESKLAKLLDLPDDKFDAFLAAATTEPEDKDAELTDAELEKLLASLPDDGNNNGDGGDEDGEGEGEGGEEEAAEEREPVGASLSAEAQAAIDLANSRADETSLELARVTSALNKAAFEKERDFFSREFGIPPRITDLARPVLEGEGHTVDLANGTEVDAGAIVRKVLKEVGQTVRMLDLSGELGTPLDFSAEAEKAEQDKATENRKAIVSEMLSGKYGL